MPISDGLEEFGVWFNVELPVTRDSQIKSVYVFENGEVIRYSISAENILIEDIHDLPKDEITKLASEMADNLMDEKVSIDKTSSMLGDPLIEFDLKEELPDFKEKLLYDIIINDERPILSSKYTFDLNIDDLGQNTEEMKLKMPDIHYQLSGSLEDIKKSVERYASDFFTVKTEIPMLGDEKEYMDKDILGGIEDVISEVEEYGSFKDHDEELKLPKPSSYVNDPITWVAEDSSLTLYNQMIQQTVFDTTFSGVKAGSESAIVTFVEEGFIGFVLDDPSVKKDNITIEGK